MSRIATVFGATGVQGGSVVRELLKAGVFKPRAVTRNASSDSAKKLAELGADVVEGDLANYESVKKAIAGAEVVFAVSIPARGAGPSELEQGKFMVDAAKEAGVKYFVWSSLPSISGISGGKYPPSPVDDKAAVDEYLRASGLSHSILFTGGFLENYVRPEFPDFAKLDENGEVAFKTRWVKGTLAILSWIDRDQGLSVSALFNAYANGRLSEINGKSYVVGSARVRIEDWFDIMEKTLGKKVNVTWLDTLGFVFVDNLYDSAKEFPWYSDMECPDPGLVALGVKFGTLEDFLNSVLKPHLGL